MKDDLFFYGLAPRWFTGDCLYRIYITPERLCGGYVAGQIFDRQSAAIQLQMCYLFLKSLVDRLLKKRKEREHAYDGMEPTDEEFLEYDRRNFHIDRRQVVSIRVNRKRSYWTPYNVGTVNFRLTDGSLRRLILVGDQDPDQIAKELSRFSPDTELIGTAKPRPTSAKPPRPLWVSYACFGALFFGIALFFLVAAILQLPRMNSWLMASFNLLGALYCLRKALKYRKLTPRNENAES